jgi:hypothetical protein
MSSSVHGAAATLMLPHLLFLAWVRKPEAVTLP